MKEIMIVDDEEDVLSLIGDILKSGGYKVKKYLSGIDAVNDTLNWKPDLIVLDIMMSEMSGWEVLKILKSNDKTASIPVILLTCKGEMKDMIMGIQEGAFDYITKPFKSDDLLKKVSFALKKGEKKDG